MYNYCKDLFMAGIIAVFDTQEEIQSGFQALRKYARNPQALLCFFH